MLIEGFFHKLKGPEFSAVMQLMSQWSADCIANNMLKKIPVPCGTNLKEIIAGN